MKPIHKITKDVQVGIYNSGYIARIYKDKIIVVSPYVKWVGNTGVYAEAKKSIRDQKIVDKIIAAINDECEDTVWAVIGNYLQDNYLLLTIIAPAQAGD